MFSLKANVSSDPGKSVVCIVAGLVKFVHMRWAFCDEVSNGYSVLQVQVRRQRKGRHYSSHQGTLRSKTNATDERFMTDGFKKRFNLNPI